VKSKKHRSFSRFYHLFVFLLFFYTTLFAVCDVGVVFDFSGASTKTITLFSGIVSFKDFSGSVFVPWEFLVEKGKALQTLKPLVTSGKLEILGGSFYDLEFSKVNEDVIYSQVKRYKGISEEFFQTQIKGFYAPAGLLRNEDFQTLKNLGFSYFLADANQNPQKNSPENLQPFLTPIGLIGYPICEDLSRVASDPRNPTWLDEMHMLLSKTATSVSLKIPAGSFIFVVKLKDFDSESLKNFLEEIEKLGLNPRKISQLYEKQPPYFMEVQKIEESEKKPQNLFSEIFEGNFKAFLKNLNEFSPAARENILFLGGREFFAPPLTDEKISFIIEKFSKAYRETPVFRFETPNFKITAIDNGIYRAYFGEKTSSILFMASIKDKKFFAGNSEIPLGVKDYFTGKEFESLWDVKISTQQKGISVITAQIAPAPFYIKKTFIFQDQKPIIKHFISVENTSSESEPLEVSLDISPVDSKEIFLLSTKTWYKGSINNVLKEFPEIKKVVFCNGGDAFLHFDFIGNAPKFMSIKKDHSEIVWRERTLLPNERFLAEVHIGVQEFEKPSKTESFFGGEKVIFDGQALEEFWQKAQKFLDPMKDAKQGADLATVYYYSGEKASYLFLDGDFSETDVIYIARSSRIGSTKPRGRDFQFQEITDYYIAIPQTSSHPIAYEWKNPWAYTFEEGFYIFFGKNSCEIKIPKKLEEGRWGIYLEKGGEISDFSFFSVK